MTNDDPRFESIGAHNASIDGVAFERERPDDQCSAKAFAIWAHADQHDLDFQEPYLAHVRRVAAMAETIGAPRWAVAVAWLHDTIEEGHATFDEIEARFGPQVARGVWYMTNLHGHDAPLPRSERKARNRAVFLDAPEWIQAIKMLDHFDRLSRARQMGKRGNDQILYAQESIALALTCHASMADAAGALLLKEATEVLLENY